MSEESFDPQPFSMEALDLRAKDLYLNLKVDLSSDEFWFNP